MFKYCCAVRTNPCSLIHNVFLSANYESAMCRVLNLQTKLRQIRNKEFGMRQRRICTRAHTDTHTVIEKQ